MGEVDLKSETTGSERLTPSSPAFEPHFTVQKVAEMWNLSTDAIRRIFRNEPGVLAISPRQRKGKRSYLTLRIPQSVLERVHRKWLLVR